jgi:ankyrin repeat protein
MCVSQKSGQEIFNLIVLAEKYSHSCQANPKLADRKDDDERLPIHWATSYGHLEIAKLLAAQKNFDPDIQVCLLKRYFLVTC